MMIVETLLFPYMYSRLPTCIPTFLLFSSLFNPLGNFLKTFYTLFNCMVNVVYLFIENCVINQQNPNLQ